MRVCVCILIILCILSPAAFSQEKPKSFPPPLTDTFDPSILDQMEKRPAQVIPESLLPLFAGAESTRKPRLGSSPRVWPGSSDLNDTAPFLYGGTYVVHIFVNDGGGSWSTSSDNPFDYTRRTQAAMVKQATEWIQGEAPGNLSVTFSTSNTTTYHYVNATVSGTIGEGSDTDWMTKEAPRSAGFYDADRDSSVLDDLLEYYRTLNGANWENVIAVFHLNHTGRSFAYSEFAGTACFSKNTVSGFTVGSTARTFAHEFMHLYGASDEYRGGFVSGSCADGGCDTDFYNDWLTPVYKNGNCSSCGYEGSCIMRWVADNMFSGGVSICNDTEDHIGWRNNNENARPDLEESAPWVELTTIPPEKRIDSTFVAAGFAYDAYRWTHIEAVEYSMDGGAWKNAAATDDTYDSFEEGFTIDDTLRTDGLHTVRVRTKTANGTYQARPVAEFKVRVDRTGPAAPPLISSIPSDTTGWYGVTTCSFSWDEPDDSSGVEGYSWEFDEHPATIPAATINTHDRSKDGTPVRTGRWYMHVRAVDSLGNWGQTAHFKAKVDLTPPSAPVVTSSTHYPSYYSNKTTASFSWTATDAHSGVSAWNYLWTLNQDPTSTVSTLSRTYDDSTDADVPTTADGAYYFHVRAVDNAGNWGSVAHYKILVDMTPPRITVSCGTHPDPNAWYIADDANLSWREIVSDLSGIAYYGYVAALDDSTIVPPDTSNTGESSVDLADLESGTHYFAVQARDNAGNWGSAIPGGAGIARVSVKVDQMPPDSVTNLGSPSHYNAIGKWDCAQSADKTIDVTWTPAVDAHSGVGGYAFVWNQSATTGPMKWQRLDSTAVSASSGSLGDAANHYFHIRTVDKVGNWDEHFATIGPFTIKTAPPSPPQPYAATTGDASVTMRWHPASGVHAATYKLYRRDKNGTYGSAVASGIQDTTYTQSWPAVKNGDVYYYAVTTVDSCGLESVFSYESIAAPEYTTPGTGRHWHLSDFVNNSKGGIRGTAPQFSMHGTVTVSASDTIVIDAGSTLTSQDVSGTKKLYVKGTLIADGSAASPILFTAAAWAGSWNGITLENPGGTSLIDHCTVQYAATGITWGGGSPKITNCKVERTSGGGIAVSPAPAMMCIIDTNTVRQCGGTGISLFASPNSTSRAAKNLVYACAAGISYNMNVGLPAPASLTIDNNVVRNQTENGIDCGNGAANTSVTNNLVLENQNGIVFDGEGWLIATPVVSGNNVSGNRTSGIYTAMQSAPLVQNNKIVQNGSYGCFSKTDAHPKYTGNTITGSLYGVMVQNSPVMVPDFGNPAGGSPGQNRLDGHTLKFVWNGGGAVMNAKNNYWGSAQANPALVIGGPSAVIWNPVWNVANQAPVVALLTPNGGTAGDNVVVTWNDAHADPDDAKINLYYDNNNIGLDGTQIANASSLSQQSAVNQFTWDTRLIPAGIYFVYALISDNSSTRNSYAPGSITIEHPDISVTPDSVAMTLAPDATALDTLTILNTGAAELNAHLSASSEWIVLGDTAKTVSPGMNALVTFTWDASGLADGSDHAGRIEITSDDHSDSLITVPASLHVETGAVDISATAIAFGGVAIDSTRTDTIEVYNTGTGALRVTGAATAPPFAVVGASFPDTLASGDTLIVSVSYTPTAPGADAGTLAVSTSDGSDPEVALGGTGLASEVRLEAASHAFGTITVGSTGAWEVHLANDGTAPLVISSAVFDSTGFSLQSPRLAASIAASDSIHLVIGFNPTEARAYVDTLRLSTSDAGAAEVALRLTGTGALPEAGLSAESIAFNGVRVGESATDSLWVRNTGEDTLSVVSAGASSPFSFVSPSLPALVLAGDSLKLSIRFTPAGTDSAADTFFVETDAPTTPVLAAGLSGWGLAPAMSLLNTLLDFGAVHADSSDTLGFDVVNVGTDTLTVDSLTLRIGERFSLGPYSMPALIPPGDTLSFGAIFAPSLAGTHVDTLSFWTDDPDDWRSRLILRAISVTPEAGIFGVMTSGSGASETNLLPDGRDFGATALGEKRREVFRLRNGGGYPLTLSSLSASPARFALDDTLSLPLTISPGGFAPIAVSYSTDSLVSHTGTLSIGTNDRETPMITVPLAGHGAISAPALSPTAIDEVVFEGESSEIFLSLMNTGENYFMYIINEREAPTTLAGAMAEVQLAARADALVVATDTPSVAAPDWKQTQLAGTRAPSSEEVAWLTALDSLGVVPGRDTIDAAVSLDAAPVAAGVYDAELLLLTNNAEMDSTTILVRMRVPRMRYADHVAGFRATVTDEGAFGFHDTGQAFSYGSGFIYPISGGQSALFSGSLWVGKDTLHVSDASYDFDFEALPDGRLTMESGDPQRSLARFTDSQAPSGLMINVKQECLSYADPANDDFLVVSYTITNVSGAALARVYAGLWLDWDIGLYSNNRGRFDHTLETGYMWNSVQSGLPYAGVTALSPASCTSFRLIHNPTYLYPYFTIRDRDKYLFMSAGAADTATTATQDWSMVMSAGPFDMAAGDSVRVSFAIVAGQTQQALLDNAAEARDLMATPAEPVPVASRLILDQCYPNPFNPTTRIEFETPQPGRVQLTIFSVKGEVVARVLDTRLPAGRHFATWNGRNDLGRSAASGVYFYRLTAEKSPSLTRKMVLLR